MKKSDGDKIRLLHIQQGISYIEAFLENKTKQDLYDDPLIRFAVERQLEIIGEAANRLSVQLNWNITKLNGKEWLVSGISWHMNILAYLELVWDIVDNKIPLLKATTERLLAKLDL